MHAAGKRWSSTAHTAGVGSTEDSREKEWGEVYKRNPNGPGPNKYSPVN